MAAATRATVSVVGRAVAAHDFAVAGADAPETGRLDLEQPDESSLAPLPGNVEPKAVRAVPSMLSNLGKALTHPNIPLPRVSSQEVTDAMDYLASTAPFLSEEERQDWLQTTRAPGNLEKIIAGAQRSAISIPESFTSVFGAATMGTGALGVTGSRIVAGGFSAHMADSMPGQFKQLKAALAGGDAEAITEASGNLLATGAMVAMTGKHALTKPKTPLETVAPLTAEAVAKVNPEPTPELKPGDVLPNPLPPVTELAPTPTPLTTEAVAKVVEPVPEPPLKGPKLNSAFRKAYDSADPQKQADILGEMGYDVNPENGRFFMEGRDNEKMYLTGEQLAEAKREFIRRAEKEPVIEAPTPTPAAVAGESGTKPAPVTAGVEPPAKPSVTPEVTTAKPEGERTLTTEPMANSRLAADVPIQEPYSDKFAVSLQVNTASPSVSDAAVIGSLPEALRGSVDTVRRFQGEVVPTNKATSIPGRIELVFKDKASAQAAVDYFKGQTPAPKWTAATRAGIELGKQTLAGIPDPVATIKAVIALAKEASPHIKRAGEAVARAARSAKEGVGEFVGEQMKAQRMTDYRRSVLNWSSKLQQSFGEADSAQKEIRKAVPDAVRREGITNWIQAGGDAAVLRARADATADPKLKAGYEAALSLTPEELAVANDVRVAFEELGQRGQTYDVLNSFKENYVTQTWDLGRGPATGGSRTLKEKFRFSKASTFPTYFDGEQAGYVPKTKDISKLLPMYLHEMNSVIAARQLVQEMAGGVGSDGRPLVAARGGGVPVEGAEGKATLIMPKKVAKDTGDYKVLENQPALSGWRWASKDSEGNPIFLKADLALHPEAYSRLKNVLGKSAVREWYETRTSAAAQIPKLLVKAIDVAQNETKRTMLGFFAPFHQVQEGTHAVGHRINPFFSIPKIDLVKDAGQVDATKHGLMLLPDRTSAEQFMEGFRHSGIVSMIPKIGPAADWYSHYLFQEYIPGLKLKTYEHILERNSKVYEKELSGGELKTEDVKVLSAEQANAAYGHLNYADLARNPTVQHMARMFLLAPDFFEARARFTAQGAKGIGGGKVGREQILALATLAIAQTATAWIAAETTGGHWDAKHPFEMVHGDRRYSMRSVPEDIAGLIADSRKFVYSRLSPLVGKGIVQGLSGVDYKGDKVSAGDTLKELAQAPIPLPLRGFVGTSNRNLSAFEELAGSVGLRISRYLPEPVMHGIQLRDEVDLWINRSKKLDTDEERADYLNKQLTDLSVEDRKKAVVRIKQRTAPGVRKRVR